MSNFTSYKSDPIERLIDYVDYNKSSMEKIMDEYIRESTDKNTIPVMYILGQSNGNGAGLQTEIPTITSYNFRPVITPAKDGFTVKADGTIIEYNANETTPIAQSPPITEVLQDAPVRIFYKPNNAKTYNGSWVDIASDKLMAYQVGHFGVEYPIAYYWATKIYPLIKKPLHIIKFTVGGSYLGDVNLNWSNNPTQLWDTFLNYVHKPAIMALQEQGYTPSCIGINWMQGEADSHEIYTFYNQYESNLRELITVRFPKLGFPNVKVYIMGMSDYDWSITAAPQRVAYWNKVKQAQINICEGSNKIENCYLIRTDGSDGIPCPRHLASSGLNHIHYSTMGILAISAKIIRLLDWNGIEYTKSNDFEFVANTKEIGEFNNNSEIVPANNTGGQLVVGDFLHEDNEYKRCLTWYSSPSIPQKTVWSNTPLNGTDSPSFRIVSMDNTTNQEVILKCSYRMGSPNGCQLMICLRANYNEMTKEINSGWGIGLGTDNNTTPTEHRVLTYSFKPGNGGPTYTAYTSLSTDEAVLATIDAGESIYYRITLIGNVLTCYASRTLYSGWDVVNTYTDATNVLPTSGNLYIQCFQGLPRNPIAGHYREFPCAFDVIIANKL